jgi:4-hydroxythreonine-4-phosphate dehydrogenase
MPTSTIRALSFKKIALTTGDPNGIGFEVTAKSLSQFNCSAKEFPLFFLFRDSKQEKTQANLFKLIDKSWTRITFYSLDVALAFSKTISSTDLFKKRILVDLSLTSSAADWVFETTQACRDKKLDSLVTAPLSKTLIKKAGYKQIGHTGIFRSFFPKQPLHMGFIGKDFSVMLATDHISLEKVPAALTKKSLSEALKSARILQKALGSKKDIAVLGLNPHAGENGLIGSTEKKILSNLKKPFVGPLVPDAAFLKKNWSHYSLFVCLYHDQGLIPFKMHHGQDSGVHVTLGLPFVRTSVDHGTAFDIFNKNMANPASMLDAIHFNLKLLKRS